MLNTLKRIIKHTITTRFSIYRNIPETTLLEFERIIKNSEKNHTAEVCLVIENSLSLFQIFKKISSRTRAEQLFSHFRVWDTKNNNGILIYCLFADQRIEIVLDRGAQAKISQAELQQLLDIVSENFNNREFTKGIKEALKELDILCNRYFQLINEEERYENELSDRVVVI